MPNQLFYTLRNPGHVYRCYHADAFQRYNTLGVRQTSIAGVTYTDCAASADPLYSSPDLILQNRPGRPFIIEPTLSSGSAVVTADLGREISIYCLEFYFLGPNLDPNSISVETSLDGSSWTELSGVTRFWTDKWRVMGGARMARYVRATLSGFRGASIRMNGMRCLPDAVNGPALFDHEGFSAHDTAYLATDTLKQWGTYSLGKSALTDWHAQNMPWEKYAIGAVGKPSDASHRIIWTNPQSLKAFKFAFRDLGTGLDAWQHGAAIEASVFGGSLTTIWETTDPVTSDTVVVLDEPILATDIRVVNKYGASYPVGSRTYSTFGSSGTDIEGQAGNGTGALHRLHVATYSADSPREADFTINVPVSGRLSVALRDNTTDQIVRHLWWSEPVTAGVKEFWWDSADFRGSFLGEKTVYPVALFSQASVSNLGGVGHHLQDPGDQTAYDSARNTLGSMRVIHYTADGTHVVSGAGFEEGDVHLAYESTTDYSRTWEQYSAFVETYSLASDATYIYAVSATASGHLLRRINRSDGGGVTTLATVNASTASTAEIIGLSAEPSGHLFYLDVDTASVVIRTKAGAVVDASALTGLTSPRGFCLDPRGGAFWVAYGSVIRKFEYDGSYVVNGTHVAEITGVPSTVHSLHVIERTSGQWSLIYATPGTTYALNEYDVTTNTPSATGALHQTVTERRHDEAWDWRNPVFIGAFGIGPDGKHAWSDTASRSVAFFDADGTLENYGLREFQGAPRWSPEGVVDGVAKLTTAVAEYEVAVDGSTLSGGIGDGTWKPTKTLCDDRFQHWNRIQSPTGYFTATTPWGEIAYLVHCGVDRGVSIFQIMPDGSRRRCGKVGWGNAGKWYGITGDGSVTSDNDYIWVDTDGDGIIDVDPGTEASPQGEVEYFGAHESDGRPTFDRSGRMMLVANSYGYLFNQPLVLAPRFELVDGSDPAAVNVTYDFNRAYMALAVPTPLVSSDTSYNYQGMGSDESGGLVLLERGVENEGYAVRCLRDGTLLRHSFLITRQSSNSFNSWIEGDQNGTPIGAVGACGTRIDRLNAKLSHPDAADFNFDRTDSWSLEAYLVPHQETGGGLIWAKYDVDAPHRGILVTVNSSRQIQIWLRNSLADAIEVYTTAAMTRNQPYHLVVTYSGSGTAAGVVIYLNGSAQTKTTVLDALTGTLVNSQPATLMRRHDNNVGLQGVLGQVRIWSGRVLSAGDVTGLYEAGVVKRYADLTAGQQASLVADWPLDDETQVTTRANVLMPSNPLTDSGLVPAALRVRESSQVGAVPDDLMFEVVSQSEGEASAGDTGFGSAFFIRDSATGLPVLAFSSGGTWTQPDHPWVAGWQDTDHGMHFQRLSSSSVLAAAMHVKSSAYAIMRFDGLGQTAKVEGDPIAWTDRYTVASGGGQALEIEWTISRSRGLGVQGKIGYRIGYTPTNRS